MAQDRNVVYICDQCGKREPEDNYRAPIGWMDLDDARYDGDFEPPDLCSMACVRDYAAERA